MYADIISVNCVVNGFGKRQKVFIEIYPWHNAACMGGVVLFEKMRRFTK